MARTPTYSATVLADKPVAYYRCDSAASLADSSGNALNGTATNVATIAGLLAGDANLGLSFNGTTSHCDVTDNALLDFTSAITIEAWVKPSAVTGQYSIISKGNTQFELGIHGSSFIFNAVSTQDLYTFGPTLVAGTVYHVVFSLDAYKAFGCVNGVIYPLAVSLASPPPLVAEGLALRLGENSGGGRFFSGVIDEAVIYKYALSEELALSHYIAGATATPAAPTSVIEISQNSAASSDYFTLVSADTPYVYYRCGDAVASATLHQEIANGHNDTGTVHGTVTFGQTGGVTGDTDTAAKFDGSTGYVNVNDVIADLGVSPITLESWVKLTSLPAVRGYAILKVGSYSLAVLASGKMEAVFVNGASSVTVVGATTLSTGVWYHLVAVYDGANVTIYVNGIREAAPTAYAGGVASNTADLQFGANGGGAANFLAATLDEIAVYKYTLIPARIAAHYAARVVGRPQTWTDISAYVRSYTVSAGRQHELDRYEAATATLVLKNTDRRFEPGFTGSPYYPNIVPYKQLRISELKDGVKFPVFTGWIERWPEAWQGPTYNEVTIDCVDGFDLLATNDFPAAAIPASASTPTMLYDTLVLGGNWDWTNYPVVRDGGAFTMNRPSGDPLNALDVARGCEDTEGGEFYIDRRGRPNFRSLNSRVGTPSLCTFGDTSAEVRYQDLRPSLDKDRIVNDVQVTRQGGTLQEATDYDSIIAYGRRSVAISTFHVSDADALTLATDVLLVEKQPGLRFEQISFSEGTATDNALLVQLLVRQLGDRVTVKRRPDPANPSSLMQQDCLISQIRIARKPKQLSVTWQLVPAP